MIQLIMGRLRVSFEVTPELSTKHRLLGMSRSLTLALWKLWHIVMASRWQSKLVINEYIWRPIALMLSSSRREEKCGVRSLAMFWRKLWSLAKAYLISLSLLLIEYVIK
jgi:hypothetical protein